MKTNYNISILVIDDDPVTKFLHKALVESLGINIFFYECVNGEDALNLIQRIGKPVPDIILCDINMPIMNGFDFIKEFKKLPGCESTQIIIISSSQSPIDFAKANELGINQIILKPLTKSFLEFVICEALIHAAA